MRPDYERVRYLLADPAFSPADDPVQPLAAAMVGRANAFLSLCPDAATRETGTPGTVSRRLLVDLGDPSGPAVGRLLEALLAAPDGFETFRTVGGAVGPHGSDWPTRDPRSLAGHLLGWSPKQVRTTFERLLRDGLVGGGKSAGNQPYLYALPDRLRPSGSAFLRLPDPAALEAAPPATAGPPAGADEMPSFDGEGASPPVAGPPAHPVTGDRHDP